MGVRFRVISASLAPHYKVLTLMTALRYLALSFCLSDYPTDFGA